MNPPRPSIPSPTAGPRARRRLVPAGMLTALLALSHPAPAGTLPPLPEPLYGVTVETVDDLDEIVTALGSLPKRPTTRIVFQAEHSPRYYAKAVAGIGQVSYLMGEILDSSAVKQFTKAQYAARTAKFLKAFGNRVDLWEVGNEVNGEWLGNTRGVVKKITSAYKQVRARGLRTALTLIYNEGCWDKPDHEMFTWARRNIPESMKQGLDYVLVSYYEEDCDNLRPDWEAVFARLAAMFPNSKLGFGEVGIKAKAAKADYLDRYYALRISEPHYIGGYFWWYFSQDMVPMTQPLWQSLYDAIQ